MAAYGLYTHIQANKRRSVILIVGLFMLVYVMAFAGSLVADVLFHCQQAVEKCFKAFLAWHDVAFRKTHSLEELGEQCLSIDRTLEPLVDRSVPLTEYAWKFRYPGNYDEPSPGEAVEGLRLVEDVRGAVLARLPPEFRSV